MFLRSKLDVAVVDMKQGSQAAAFVAVVPCIQPASVDYPECLNVQICTWLRVSRKKLVDSHA